MVRFDDRGDDGVGEAVALARAIAPDVDSVLLTHYPDSETLDTFRPGETDLDAVAAVNRAVAAELAALGVKIFVQKADRGAFRRWMCEQDGTPESRRAWVELFGAEVAQLGGEQGLVPAGVERDLVDRQPGRAPAPG